MSSSRTAVLFALSLGLGVAPYAEMAPLSRYLIADRRAEIALARSAAPAVLSAHATVLVLTQRGYDTAVQGTNGFKCLVERSCESPFDNADFWNWKLRGPVCYNPPASRTVLRYTIFRTKMALAGVGKAQMLDRFQAAITNRQLPPAAQGSMAYMMSKQQYLGDSPKAWHPHLMFYAPQADGDGSGASWGADRRGSPVLFDSSDHIMPEPWALFFVPVAHWSDGSPAPSM